MTLTPRLTPVDILNLRFRRAVGGYSIAEVDEFVRRVASDMETLLTEAAAHRDRLQRMENEIAQYRALENTMRDALILAQRTSDETRSAARLQADAQIREAQGRVREIEAQAQARLDAVGTQIERLHQERRQLARRLKVQLTEQLQWLSQELEPAPALGPITALEASPSDVDLDNKIGPSQCTALSSPPVETVSHTDLPLPIATPHSSLWRQD